MGVTQCNLNNQLNKIRIPTLVIIGKEDRIISPRRSRELSKEIPGAKLKLISGAGHYPHLENVSVTANTIDEFIKNSDESNIPA